jgi:tRNA(Ile2) C34 agmatinyltransferase TiaS
MVKARCPQCNRELEPTGTTWGRWGNTYYCPACEASFSRPSIHLSGTNQRQVLVVASGLIAIVFIFAVAWNLIFG